MGNGWFGVLDALCEGLQGVTERGGPQILAAQVVESFGVLHFDTHRSGVNDEQSTPRRPRGGRCFCYARVKRRVSLLRCSD